MLIPPIPLASFVLSSKYVNLICTLSSALWQISTEEHMPGIIATLPL